MDTGKYLLETIKNYNKYSITLTIAITGNLQICEQQTTINNRKL